MAAVYYRIPTPDLKQALQSNNAKYFKAILDKDFIQYKGFNMHYFNVIMLMNYADKCDEIIKIYKVYCDHIEKLANELNVEKRITYMEDNAINMTRKGMAKLFNLGFNQALFKKSTKDIVIRARVKRQNVVKNILSETQLNSDVISCILPFIEY